MIPPALAFVLLALAALRCWRLLALDTLPPLVRARSWLVGVEWETRSGETSSDEAGGLKAENHWTISTPVFKRPLLAEWLECAWCSGLLVAAAWYGAWLLWPRVSLYAAAPLALSAALGCAASWLPE